MTKQAEQALELVREIAEEDPIYPDDWTNRCKYCHVAWPDDPGKSHMPDCIYIRAIGVLGDSV